MNVKKILVQYENLESRRFAGNLDATDTLLDLAHAIEVAELTKTQKAYIHYFYVQGFTGEEIGKMFGTTRSSVNDTLRRAEKRIQTVYDGWNE